MQNGTYVVTVCTKERHWLLGEIRDARMELSEYGVHVRACIEEISIHYPSVFLDSYVIMPNHAHMLLTFLDFSGNPELSRLLKQLKAAVSKRIGFALWQENCYTSVILTAQRMRAARQYIHSNPVNWLKDQFACPEGE